MAGKPVRLVIAARRFHCDGVLCGRRIFAERFAGDILAPWARRTARLDHIVHHLGLALGGRPAASFAQRLMPPVSNDTLLRVVRRRGSPRFVPPTVIGIDDWAWRRNQRYGTIICDLDRRPTQQDRAVATAKRPRVPSAPAGCHRVGCAPPKSKKGRWERLEPSAIRPDLCHHGIVEHLA
jgi:hypothetical protein